MDEKLERQIYKEVTEEAISKGVLSREQLRELQEIVGRQRWLIVAALHSESNFEALKAH